jgi:hypothetical protein
MIVTGLNRRSPFDDIQMQPLRIDRQIELAQVTKRGVPRI